MPLSTLYVWSAPFNTHEVLPRLENPVAFDAVFGAAVEPEEPLAVRRAPPGGVRVDVPQAERLREILEGDVGPHPDRDLEGGRRTCNNNNNNKNRSDYVNNNPF